MKTLLALLTLILCLNNIALGNLVFTITTEPRGGIGCAAYAGTADGLCVQVQPGDVQGFYDALWSCCVSGTTYTCCDITNRTGERYMNMNLK